MQAWAKIPALALTGGAILGMSLSASELHGFICKVRAQPVPLKGCCEEAVT